MIQLCNRMSNPPPTPVEMLEYHQAPLEPSRLLPIIGFVGLVMSFQRIAFALLYFSFLQDYATYSPPPPEYKYIWVIADAGATVILGIVLMVASFGLLRNKSWATRLLQMNEKCAVIFYLLSDVFDSIRGLYMLNHGQTSNWGLIRGFLTTQMDLLLYLIFPLMSLLLTQAQPMTRIFNSIQIRISDRQGRP
jgi:hypothetical protein